MITTRRATVFLAAIGFASAAALLFSFPAPAAQSSAQRETAYHANNVGVAQLEQFSYDEAAGSFRRALAADAELTIAHLNLGLALLYGGKADEAVAEAQATIARLPDLPQAHYLLGLAARAQGRVDDAVAPFRRVVQIDPADAGSRINLGQILTQQRAYGEAITLFREALTAEPYNATAAYGLATALTRSGAADEGRTAMQRFETLRDAPYAVTYSQNYLEQGRYGEAIASTGAEPALVDPATPDVKFVDATIGVLPRSATIRPRSSYSSIDYGKLGSVTLFDLDGDGDLDAYAVHPTGERLYVNTSRGSARTFEDVTGARGLATGITAAAPTAVVGDVDNDRRPDILTLRPDGYRLLRQRVDGRFENVSPKAGLRQLVSYPASAALVDIDHDGDLDLFVAGDGRLSSNQLFRNSGTGTFTDITAAAGVAAEKTLNVAVAPTDFDNRRDIDLLVLGEKGAPRLFKNMRDGTFRDVAADVGLPRGDSYTALAAGDVNKDGYTDFFFTRAEGQGILALSDGHGKFSTGGGPANVSARRVLPATAQFADFPRVTAQFVDYDNDGLLDLFLATGAKLELFRNLGTRWLDVSASAGLAALMPDPKVWVTAVSFGDIDRDGDLDALVLTTDGVLRYWRNDGGSAQRSVLVALSGRVSNRAGVGAKVDLRAGSLRQRIETSAATPALAPADVLFGLGRRTAADVVRVIWPSGTLQAELASDARTVKVEELDRKPSSCPYLYTWNGTRFEFVTDFMGGGEIGYWMAPGVWNTPDPDEYVRIPPGMLVPRDGRYELRVTNELEEALFVDRLQLVAVDHPRGVDVFPNEGLGAPNTSTFTLTTARGPRPPLAAADEHGHDVLSKVASLDRLYPDDFELSDIRGYARSHELRLNLGENNRDVVLLATGWTDYAFSSDNLAAHHRGMTLAPPSLEARTPAGTWRTVVADVGIPVGRPQTIVIDLRGKLAPAEHDVRIVTNMRIYWDQILVDVSGGRSATRITRVDPKQAVLGWRGYSADLADGRQPQRFDYQRVTGTSPWKTMVGRYTREGDVRELLLGEDDLFVISKPGDEIALSFDAAALPPLAADQARTFLLYSFGYSKEMDVTSATPYTVEPLPFRAMRSYPYGEDQQYPTTALHREYRDRYNTRVVGREIGSGLSALGSGQNGPGPQTHGSGPAKKP